MDKEETRVLMELSERVASLEAREEPRDEDIKIMKDNIGKLLSKVGKWESRFGAAIFIIGCLWAFFKTFGATIVLYIKTGEIKW